MEPKHLLVVDDELFFRELLKDKLEKAGYTVELCESVEQAEKTLHEDYFDVVLSDIVMPGKTGMDLLKLLKEFDPEKPVILFTAHGRIEEAVKAMQEGAYDYITKPLDFYDLLNKVARATEKYDLVRANRVLVNQLTTRYRFENIIGNSGKMQEVFAAISKVAPTKANVLILGESGTGKELVARAIHYNSKRREGPFVTVNCAAIPSELLESELFGHRKGSFTGALRDKVGRFKLAEGGTIFLDEIGAMNINLQAKILRVLQEREFEEVGGEKTIKVDVRIISATNQDLAEGIEKGTFREDLYYRLSVFPLSLPPLRERKEDIMVLSEHFLNKFSEETGKAIKGFHPHAVKALVEYSWPGNVRELENAIERAVVMAEGQVVNLEELPVVLQTRQKSKTAAEIEVGLTLRDMEREFIKKTLEALSHNKTKTAQLLGISLRGLRDKIKQFGLE
jgi:DNA-binding NtrC family response regulator